MQAQGRFWSVTLAAVLAVGVTASLGRWQMDRAAQKQALQTAVENACHPVTPSHPMKRCRPCALAPSRAADLLHRTVHLRGRWLAEHTVYLDNRQMNGRPGFFVLTPLQLEGAAHSVLVQRGWIARNFQDRTALASVETPQGEVEVTGRLALGPSRLLELARCRQGTRGFAHPAESGVGRICGRNRPGPGTLDGGADPGACRWACCVSGPHSAPGWRSTTATLSNGSGSAA
jgi:cytochrome oxidase assembly protein ShyY1